MQKQKAEVLKTGIFSSFFPYLHSLQGFGIYDLGYFSRIYGYMQLLNAQKLARSDCVQGRNV